MQFFKKIIIYILTLESQLILDKYKPFIVAVVGSVGKTSTKDAIFSVLKDNESFVRKSEKSMNTDIGLPLTIIGAPNVGRSLFAWLRNVRKGIGLILVKNDYPTCLVLEIGADHPGDIRKIAKWLSPNILVVTKISRTPVHVEFFKSPEQLFEEKASLVGSVQAKGTLVLFADDNKVLALRDRIKGKDVQVLSFGSDSAADLNCSEPEIYYAENGDIKYPVGLKLRVNFGKDTSKDIIVKHVIGRTYIYPILAAAAVGKARGMSADDIIRALNDYEPPKGRMNIVRGMNDSVIIDDTYNSSPDAVLAALKTLNDVSMSVAVSVYPSNVMGSHARKIAVFGDMLELGKYSAEEHRKIGKEAAHTLSILVTVGMRSTATMDEALKNGLSKECVKHFDTAKEAAAYLPSIVQSGDIILVKGSQSIRMERVVKALMKEPDKADKVLVRQEREWLEKA